MYPDSAAVKKSKRALQFVFLVCGLGISSWVPMVPYVKDKLGLNEEQLGLLLLFLGGGALVMMPIGGIIIPRWGSRRVMVIGTILMAMLLPVLLIISSAVPMAIALFLFGGGIGMIDAAMNAHAVHVQHVWGRPIMSSFHGLFSVGGLFGALGLGFLVKIGLPPLVASACVALLLLFLVMLQAKNLFVLSTERAIENRFNFQEESKDAIDRSAWLHPGILFFGAMCFCCFLAEGAMLDWSAVYLRDIKSWPDAITGAGFATFSVAMAIMRLSGDGLLQKIKPVTVVVTGCLVAATGLCITVIASGYFAVLSGYFLLGIGAANLVPFFFSAGGKFPGVSPAKSIPVITTLGYAGQLTGPAALGFIGHTWSLSFAFVVCAGLLLLVAVAYVLKHFCSTKR